MKLKDRDGLMCKRMYSTMRNLCPYISSRAMAIVFPDRCLLAFEHEASGVMPGKYRDSPDSHQSQSMYSAHCRSTIILSRSMQIVSGSKQRRSGRSRSPPRLGSSTGVGRTNEHRPDYGYSGLRLQTKRKYREQYRGSIARHAGEEPEGDGLPSR